MSASPTNANLEASGSAEPQTAVAPQAVAAAPVTSPGREALQALLAFSALHQQIRERRAQQRNHGAQSSADPWQVDQFALDEVLQLVVERAMAVTGSDGVAVALADGDEIICRASCGNMVPDRGVRLDPTSGFSGLCFRSGRVVRCDNVEDDPRVDAQAAQRLGARSMVAVPLAGQQNTIGLLEAFSYDAYAFNDSDVRSLSLLAELVLAAIKPEEEDRMAQISRMVAARAMEAPPVPAPVAVLVEPEPEHAKEVSEEVKTPEIPIRKSVPLATYEEVKHSRPGLAVVVAIVLFAVSLGGAGWWYLRSKMQVVKANAPVNVPQSAPPPVAVAPQAAPEAPQDDLTPAMLMDPSSPPVKQKLSVLPQVTAVRHWSSDDSSTVVIDLQDQIPYEAHRLTDPDRIYFDLHDTALAPGLFGKSIQVSDAHLLRIRVAQPMPGVTRVVLDTKGSSNFSVSLEPNPYRLVVEIRGTAAPVQPRSAVDLFGPTPTTTPVAPTKDDLQLRAHVPSLRIVLDAGHGGWDLGTVGRQGLLEKDLVLDIVKRLGNLLDKRLGADVIYTRGDDTYIPLERRAEIANEDQADFFLSVHANYSDLPSSRGVETYYTNTFSSVNAHSRDTIGGGRLQGISFANVDIRAKVLESRRFAASVQRSLFDTLALKNPGLRDRGVKEASYVVLTGTSMPAALAEVSFVSSPTDERNLQSEHYRQEIAEALYKGITRFVASNSSRPARVARTSARPAGR